MGIVEWGRECMETMAGSAAGFIHPRFDAVLLACRSQRQSDTMRQICADAAHTCAGLPASAITDLLAVATLSGSQAIATSKARFGLQWLKPPDKRISMSKAE